MSEQEKTYLGSYQEKFKDQILQFEYFYLPKESQAIILESRRQVLEVAFQPHLEYEFNSFGELQGCINLVSNQSTHSKDLDTEFHLPRILGIKIFSQENHLSTIHSDSYEIDTYFFYPEVNLIRHQSVHEVFYTHQDTVQTVNTKFLRPHEEQFLLEFVPEL